MNFIPTWETRNSVETSFAAWHPDFWSGFARRGTVVPGGECVKKTAENCKFPAEFAIELSIVCGSYCSCPFELRERMLRPSHEDFSLPCATEFLR
jgi:hypothetical protein